jgi:Mn-dependent DtxR family transcriptional regulator
MGRKIPTSRATQSRLMSHTEQLDLLVQAIQLYAETHPRPFHVTQKQAAEMMDKSQPTINSMVKRGKLKLNEFGMIPITEIDRALTVS